LENRARISIYDQPALYPNIRISDHEYAQKTNDAMLGDEQKQRLEGGNRGWSEETELIQMWIQQFSAEVGDNVHQLPDKNSKS
jgi:hypothetical protein